MKTAPKVLIVDDDPALLTALPEALRLRLPQVSVETCNSAINAIDRVAHFDYDVIVSDIKMPGMDGLALLSEIKAIRPDTPTLLITGHGEHDLTVQALRGGAYDFIPKPIERDYFIAALTRAIQVRQLKREIDEGRETLQRYANDLERTIEDRTYELQEANRIKDEFLATLSHELRAPLNSILGWAQLLRGGLSDEEATDRALKTIVRSARALAEIIDDLLDVSRIITGKLKLDSRLISLEAVIEAAVDAVRLAAESRRIELIALIDQSATPVFGDPNRLQQVVWNLLSNSIKFTPAGGKVVVELKRQDGAATISVNDNGEGISQEFLPYVFDRFRQADSGYTRRHGGLGLGLAIVRHLVEMHGGEVRAYSPGKGQGSAFSVSLPLATPSEVGESSLRRSNTGPLTLDSALQDLRVLVVDDDSDARELIVTMLTRHGAEVAAVSSAGEVTDWLQTNAPPDVLVSDIGMPGEDGLALINNLRALGFQDTKEIPALALTAYARPEERERILSCGYRAHITKPVEPAVLVREITTLVAERCRKQQHRTNAI